MQRVHVRVPGILAQREAVQDVDFVTGGQPVLDAEIKRKGSIVPVR
jgi:hypothetical protein